MVSCHYKHLHELIRFPPDHGIVCVPAASVCALQEAGIPKKLAPTIGIAVDHRRRNRSLESLQVRDSWQQCNWCVCIAGGGGVGWGCWLCPKQRVGQCFKIDTKVTRGFAS